jgi:hypothetical protein
MSGSGASMRGCVIDTLRSTGKDVDWVHHYVEDGTLYVCIRFQDRTDFALEFRPQIVRVGTELCDSATEDFDVIRN